MNVFLLSYTFYLLFDLCFYAWFFDLSFFISFGGDLNVSL